MQPAFEASTALPADAEALGRAVLPDAARHKAFKQCHASLGAIEPSAALAARTLQLENLFKWIRTGTKAPALPDSNPADRPQIGRLRLLCAALEHFPGYRPRLAELVSRTLSEVNGTPLLARLGIPGDRGFFGETVDRLSARFLPEAVDERSLIQLCARLFPSKRDATWLAGVPDALLIRLVGLVPGFSPLLLACCDAIALLATRISAVGLSEVIRARSPAESLQASAFYRLPRSCDLLIATSAMDPGGLSERARQCRGVMEECRVVVARVIENLEERGVSVDVVYRLELITKNLERLETLIERLLGRQHPDAAARARDLLVSLTEARHRERELGEIIRNNLHLLARKIIERAGHTGEHYITSTRGEYFKMLASAGGGGVLTAGTTALKYLTAWAHFAPFVEGALSAMNYAGSFLLMQLLGFTLATKQPSVTAAALAGSLRETAGHPDLTGLVGTIARITRSQLAAAVGNVGMVIPAAIVFDQVYRRHFEHSFLDADTAKYVLHSLHLTHSGSIFYAALTGVLLWASSVAAGWLENWATYRRLPEAIAEHRYGRFLGRRTMAWVSRVFSRNIAGFGGNTTLGVLLGMTPVMGKFFGLPLDVRHVTLSTGALTLSVCSLGPELEQADLFWAAAGIAVIGMLNFGVSFVLALTVALRAREVDRSDRFRLLASVIATFFRSPLQFFFPPASGAAPVHGPVSVRPPPVH